MRAQHELDGVGAGAAVPVKPQPQPAARAIIRHELCVLQIARCGWGGARVGGQPHAASKLDDEKHLFMQKGKPPPRPDVSRASSGTRHRQLGMWPRYL